MSDTEQATGVTEPAAQVITATRNLKSQPFTPGYDPFGTGKTWNDWLSEEIEREISYFKITKPTRKMLSSFMAGRKSLVWRNAHQIQRMALTTTISGGKS